jgi:hypothetical protein
LAILVRVGRDGSIRVVGLGGADLKALGLSAGKTKETQLDSEPLAVVPSAVKAQKPTPKKGGLPKSNRVYVKIILPTDPATRDKDRPVVESWIAEQLRKRGQSKFTAATAWVPLADAWDESTPVWDGGCRVGGYIAKRADGRIKVFLDGWGPGAGGVTVSLTDEPGSREIAAVEIAKTEQGLPYVAVLIGPPPEKTAAPADHKKEANKGAADDIKPPRIALDKIPKSVLDAVKTRFPTGEMSRAYLFDEGLGVEYHINIKNKGQKITVLVNWNALIVKVVNGQKTVHRQPAIFRLKKEIGTNDLPQVVRKALDDKYPNATYETIREVLDVGDKQEKLKYYLVELLVAENTTVEIQVAGDGKIIREEKFTYPTKKAKADK